LKELQEKGDNNFGVVGSLGMVVVVVVTIHRYYNGFGFFSNVFL
jgi:hypothetical protein